MSRCAYVGPETGKHCPCEASAHSRYCAGCERLAFQERTAFEGWMQEVIRALDALCGLHPDDLPDCLYADWQRAGLTPQEAAQQALAAFTGDEEG